MPRRRILTVVDSFEGDGSTSQIFEIAARLPRSRYDLRFASLFDSGPGGERLRGMKVRVYELGLRGAYPLLRAGWSLRRMVGGMKIDLVHAYHPRASVAARLAAWRQAPLVTTLSVGVDAEEPGAWFRMLDRLTTRYAQGSAVTDTEVARREALETGLRSVQVLPPFLDVGGFDGELQALSREAARTRLGFGPDEVVCFHAGPFDARGIQGHLLEAFGVALRENRHLRLALRGDGPLLTDARVLAEDLDVGDAVLFLGGEEEHAALYRAADLYVQPGVTVDGGHALLRAMAAGLPVVAAEDTSVSAFLGETARIVEGPRIEDLARAILDVAEDASARRKMGAAARSRVQAFDVGKGLPRLDELYWTLTG